MTDEAYGQAYQKGFGKTVRLLRSRGASAHHAEDIAQTAWLQGWQKLDQLRDEGMVASWINTIAVNFYRRGSRYEARYHALTELCGHVGFDLAPLDAAKILNFCSAADRMLFELQLGGLTTKRLHRSMACPRLQFGTASFGLAARCVRGWKTVRPTESSRLRQLTAAA